MVRLLLRILPKQKGIGLLELLLAMAIIGVVLMMASRYYGAATFAQQAAEVHSQFLEITQALYRYKTIKGNWSGITLNNLKPWLNKTLVINNQGWAKGPFAYTNYDVRPYIDTKNRQTVLIRLFYEDGKVDKAVCEKLANRIAGAECPNGNALDYCYPTRPCWAGQEGKGG